MADEDVAAQAALALKRISAIVRAFGMERRLEDEPAHHQRMLERLAGSEAER